MFVKYKGSIKGNNFENLCLVCMYVLYLWLERQTRDQKVPGSSPRKNSGRIFFSRVNFLCWLLFRYPFHTRVTAAQ